MQSILICTLLFGLLSWLNIFTSAQDILGGIAPGAKNRDCGRVNEVPGDPRSKTPWSAAIFLGNKAEGYRFLVGGTIISPTAVITVLGGTFGSPPRGAKGRYYIFPPKNVLIGVGMKSTYIKDNDEFSQFFGVKYIEPYKNHSSVNKEYHVFILHLDREIKFNTPFVRQICTLDLEVAAVFQNLYEVELYDFDLGLHADITNIYFIGGYTNRKAPGLDQLQVHNVVAENKRYCDNAYNYYYKATGQGAEIFCGKLFFREEKQEFPNDTCVQYGSTVFMISDDQKFMTGITALTPNKRRGLCNKNSLYFVAGTWHYIHWIYRSLKCSPNHGCGDGTCVPIEKLCDNYNDCSDGSDENPIFCQATNYCPKGSVPCHYNSPNCILEADVCFSERNCQNLEHSKNICHRFGPNKNGRNVPAQQANCEAPVQAEGDGVALICRDPNGDQIDCKNSPIGTEATFSCAEFYISRFRYSTLRMTCAGNGLWKTFRAFACEPDCGIINVPFSPYIVHGKDINRKNAFPWYGAVFIRSNPDAEFKFACGASLIEKSVIITAAHCLTDAFGVPLSLDSFRVVLAPGSNDYLTNEREFSTVSQIFSVKEMWIPRTFHRRSLTSDLALVQLSEPSKFGSFVRPICYLMKNSPNIFKTGEIGKVAGFGYDEKRGLSMNLKYLDVPIISKTECPTNRPPKTFCAGWNNGSSLCLGDGGSGLVHPLKRSGPLTRYVLMGVASLITDPKRGVEGCSSGYNVFTEIDLFQDWIIDIVNDIRFERIKCNGYS